MRNLMLPSSLLSLAALAGTAAAQDSLVFCMDSNEVTIDNGGGLVEAGLIREDETAVVTPGPGLYSASVFHSMSTQWAYISDADNDGRVVDSSSAGPGDDTDAVFVKRFPAAPVGPLGPRDVYLSKEGNAGFDTAVFEDGDVYRHSGQGVLEVFVSEVALLEALGQAPTADLDLDAICQSDTGDLFVSFADAESTAVGTADDGAILLIPAASITYDVDFNVAAIAFGSAVIVANEADVNAWIAASGMKTSVGGNPSTSIDTTALEIDPAGGTFESPVIPGLFLPNLLFAWNGFSNDGAVLSTANGGSLASLNGIPLASDVATTGAHLGLTPGSTGLFGLQGLAIIPGPTRPFAMENHPTSLITSSTILWSRQEVSGATPGGIVVFFADVGPTSGPGAIIPSLSIPGFGGELFGDGSVFLLATLPADGGGYVGNVVTLPDTLVGTGLHLLFQGFDLSTFSFSTPAPIQYL